nr:MltA domain-containing protein [Rhodoplanes elegans]
MTAGALSSRRLRIRRGRVRAFGLALVCAFGLSIDAVSAAPAARRDDPETRGHGRPPPEMPLVVEDAQLEPVTFADLPGWTDDDQAAALATFKASCRPLLRGDPAADPRPMRRALMGPCRRALAHRAGAGSESPEAARKFFEQNFRPLRISRIGEPAGFLTGYYEPIVDGSRFPNQIFKVPMYRRPPDLVAPGAKPGQPFPNRGQAFRVLPDGSSVPYYDRGEIEDGALSGRHLEIAWLKDPADLLTIQIQGSARVRLEDGTLLRVNYDGHNGFPYTPVGRVLIERGHIPREEMSMARIRDWMRDNPDEATEVRRQNRAFVFFRIVGLDVTQGPLGGQGLPLTDGRSIAVDRVLHVYGTPFFISAELPITGIRTNDPFRRTMIAQDTGSAITGPARADLYFGSGDEAGRIAGRIREPGRFAVLVPKEIDPVARGAALPLPRLRPPPLPEKPAAKPKPSRAEPRAGRRAPQR